uniref:serine/threonine-protein kinase pakA-like n=1 Tax=Erigeron canadensis TaxID=72917 RepID=UPI001CB89E3A|nr:serine/threonine-protein kinase pakA-like [Erigeron canadensis]
MEPSRGHHHAQYYYPIQPQNIESASSSSQAFLSSTLRPPDMKPVNFSIQTGEEFALEFMRDRVNPRMSFIPYSAEDPNLATSYMELKGSVGIGHPGLESRSNVSMLDIVQRGSIDNFLSMPSVHRTNSNRDNSSTRIKILCSFGGKILPRPSDRKLRYVGGVTRIIRIRKDISWQELWQKMLALYNETSSIKYQLPGEDFDALVSVSCDEDLLNMMEECKVLGHGEASKKLRMFLFSLSDLDDAHFSLANSSGDSEVQFVVAVNGLDLGSRRESSLQGQRSSSANNLNEPSRQVSNMNISNNLPPLTFISSSLSNPSSVPPNSSGAYENHSLMHDGAVSRSSFDKPLAVQQNNDGLVSQSGGFHDMQNQQPPVKKPMPNGDNSVKQEVEHGLRNEGSLNEGSVRNEAVEEKPSPEKAKMSEERHQDQEQVNSSLDTASVEKGSKINDNDSYGGSESDLIDLSYLEPLVPPPRVYHSERLPRGTAELNRLTKSDDSLGSQFTLTHSRSDVGPQDTISEDLPSQNELPPISTSKGKSKPVNDNEGIQDKQIQSGRETNTAVVNDKNVQFEKPAETRSPPRDHTDPATNHLEYSQGEQVASDSTANDAQSSTPNAHGDIIIDVNDRFPRDFLSDIFTRAMMSEDSPNVRVLPQDGAGLSVNIANHEPQHWSYFQKLAQDDFQHKDVSLIDQHQLAFSSGLPKVEEASGSQLDSTQVFAEDREKDAPYTTGPGPTAHFDPSHVEVSESMQFVDMVENMRMPESEYEAARGNVGLSTIGPSLDDFDLSSLQIIRNEDLEELRELGSGTFGTVYHGKWRGSDVAIKRIKKSCFAGRSSEQERLTIEFWREAGILSKLHHPNVVAFYGVVQDGPGGTLATVTEFMVDGSLRHVLLRKDRHLDHRKKLIIAMDAAFGMEYLHSKDIVHFDLKCDNLLVNMKDPSRPICKVGDFGLSKIKRNTLVSGGVRGTLPWMAPELLNGSSSKVSEKVDVFSFGIVLWEILTGEEPYANMHYGAIIGGIVSNTLRPPIPKDCDGEWRRLMERCWAPNPMVRPSFTEITKQLRVMSAASHSKKVTPPKDHS